MIKNLYQFVTNKILSNKIIKKSIKIYNKNDILLNCLVVIFYKILLDVVYIDIVSPSFGYLGFTTSINMFDYVISFLVVVVFIIPIIGIYEQKKASAIIITMLNFMYFIPITTLYAFGIVDIRFMLITIVYWSILLICQYKIPFLELEKKDSFLRKIFFDLSILCISGVVLYIWARYANFRLQFDVLDVYGIRAESATYKFSTILNYTLSFAGSAIPFFIVYAIDQKKKLLCATMIGIWFCNFSIYGSKTEFFMLFIVLIGYVFYKEKYIKLIPIGLILTNILTIISKYLFDNILIMDLFVRRSMLVPAKLSYNYFEFFTENHIDLLTNGLFSKIGFADVYSKGTSYIIGDYLGNTLSANNGLIGDAFSSFAYAGIIITPIVLICIFRVLDSVSYDIDKKILIVLCVYFAQAFTNATWSTTLLSHGYLFLCILLYLMPIKRGK